MVMAEDNAKWASGEADDDAKQEGSFASLRMTDFSFFTAADNCHGNGRPGKAKAYGRIESLCKQELLGCRR